MKITTLSALAVLASTFVACKKDNSGMTDTPAEKTTITVENVLNSKPLVQSGVFQGSGTSLILPGQSTTIQFSAAKGEAISFAAMYGASNDLFFAPDNPGIQVYTGDGTPIEGDVSAQVKLWDNGSRVNQKPGASVSHPGVAETRNVTEVIGTDA